MTQKVAIQWLPCQAPGVIGSALGLVGAGVSILGLGEVERLICNFCLSVTARKLVCDVRATNQQTNASSLPWDGKSEHARFVFPCAYHRRKTNCGLPLECVVLINP